MKEQMTYVAIDADNVGESVGNAVLSNDEGKLSSISESINAGVQIFSQWAEYNGGKVISSGSDEAVVQVPVTSIEELEELKEQYSQKTGFTVSIGIGETISDSAKALIYAKMNGKNQIMDYTPEMEESMKQTLSGNHQERVEEDTEQVDVPADQVDGDYGSEEMADAQPEDEKQMGEEEEFIHDAKENREDELDEDNIEADAEAGEEAMAEEGDADQALEELVDSNDPSDEDIDLDGVPDQQEEHGSIEPSSDDIDQDGDVEHEEAMAAEAGEEESYDDSADSEDEALEDEALSDSIASEMGEEISEEAPMEEEIPMEEEAVAEGEVDQFAEEIPQEQQEEIYDEEEAIEQEMEQDESVDHDSLKSVIFESLQNFKQNREHLESISQENPELYNALIYCLQAMIEMAKELGYGEGLSEEAPMEEEIEEDGDMLSEEDESMGVAEEAEEAPEEEVAIEEESEEDEGEEEDFQKNERFLGLLEKMNKAFSELALLKEEQASNEEIKEKIKEKIENKKKTKLVAKRKKAAAKKKPGIGDKKKKKTQKKESNDGSFCAKSHQKMRASGKDCRANEDKDSPLCSARRKYSCRGKNEEKNKTIEKSEKLYKFMSQARKK